MKTLMIGAVLAMYAAQVNPDAQKYEKGSTVTLQGCVTAAEKRDTFVLTGVREWPVAAASTGKFGPRMYWIDKGSKDFKGHLGHTIQVTGKITDVEKSEMELKAGESGAGTIVEVEGPGRDVRTSPPNVNVNPAARANADDIKITLLKLKIDDLKMLSSTCPITATRQ